MKQFVRRTNWSAVDRLAALACALVVLWFVLPSSLFIRSVGLSIDGTHVRYTRETPFGPVYAYWSTEMRSVNGECYAPRVPRLTLYQDRDDMLAMEGRAQSPGPLTVSYALDASLRPCLPDDGSQFVKVQTHQVKALGLLRLRPTRTRWACHADGSPCAKLD